MEYYAVIQHKEIFMQQYGGKNPKTYYYNK